MPRKRTMTGSTVLGQVVRTMASRWDAPPIRALVVADSEGTHGANTRRITITVSDAIGQILDGRWRLKVYLCATENGDPSATGNTVSWVSGFVLATHVLNAAYEVLTDVDGEAVFDLTIAGAASRRIYAEVIGEAESSGVLTWSA